MFFYMNVFTSFLKKCGLFVIYSRDELMKFLDKCCAKNKLEYDFFYLPIDFR